MGVKIDAPPEDMMKPKEGWLSLTLQTLICRILHVLCNLGVVRLPTGKGNAKIFFDLNGWVIDLTRVIFGDKSKRHPLEIYKTDTGIGVENGTVGGLKADSTMGADPFIIPLAGFGDGDYVVVAAMPSAWDANNIANTIDDDGEITIQATLPAETDDFTQCQIGLITVVSEKVTSITQTCSSSQSALREGEPGVFILTWFAAQ